MTFRIFLSTLLMILALTAPFNAARAEQKTSHWVLFGEEEVFDHYYDEANFIKTTFDVIGVWVKVVPKTDAARAGLLDERRRSAFQMEGYEDYLFTVTAIEINCVLKIKALMESRDYGKKGIVLDKVGAVRRNWTEIQKGGRYDFYQKTLCKKEPK